MVYLDYSQVRARQATREKELLSAYEKDQLLRRSGQGSKPLSGHAFEKLGDGLIRLGEWIKDAGNGRSRLTVVAGECDGWN